MGKIDCVLHIDLQREKKRQKGDRRVISNATHGIDAWRRVIRHRGFSDEAIAPGRKCFLLMWNLTTNTYRAVESFLVMVSIGRYLGMVWWVPCKSH